VNGILPAGKLAKESGRKHDGGLMTTLNLANDQPKHITNNAHARKSSQQGLWLEMRGDIVKEYNTTTPPLMTPTPTS